MHGRICIIVTLVCAGCWEHAILETRDAEEPQAPLAAVFDPARAGAVSGRVVWDGAVPRGEEKTVRAIAFDPNFYKRPARFVLPHYPQVDEPTRGVANAVVYLRGVDAQRSKAWDHEPVRVEFHERRLNVHQGKSKSGVGFVRRGSSFEFVNRDSEYHVLRGRAAALFSFPLLEANRPQSHTLAQPGIVDLNCASGYYWLHAHLFVVEHPYYTRTDSEGRFTLDRVPPGKYEVVCWLPNWRVINHERDPETGTIVRLNWQPPLEQSRAVEVRTGSTENVDFRQGAKP